MMKATTINGEIKVFNKLPDYWLGKKLYSKGFASSPVEVLEEEGFYDIVDPQYDPLTEELGDLYLEDNKYYYVVKQKTWSETLTELKEIKINLLKEQTNIKLQKSDWYYIRKVDRNIDVPNEIQQERDLILSDHTLQEQEINNLTKKIDVINYNLK